MEVPVVSVKEWLHNTGSPSIALAQDAERWSVATK
jgi:hypothetical protein